MVTRSRHVRRAKQLTTRASFSVSTKVYETLERIAEGKKVSIAWVIREAVEKYVADQWPLLEQR